MKGWSKCLAFLMVIYLFSVNRLLLDSLISCLPALVMIHLGKIQEYYVFRTKWHNHFK